MAKFLKISILVILFIFVFGIVIPKLIINDQAGLSKEEELVRSTAIVDWDNPLMNLLLFEATVKKQPNGLYKVVFYTFFGIPYHTEYLPPLS